MSNHEFVIEQADLSGQRIDKVLPELNSEWSRTQIQDWIKLSLVTVNGKVVKSNYKVKLNDQINVTEKEEPSILSRYLIYLAKEYSSFYNNCHILNEDKSLQDARLYLTYMVKTVLEKGLNLLGIQVPDKM